jgi:hypothetical protein
MQRLLLRFGPQHQQQQRAPAQAKCSPVQRVHVPVQRGQLRKEVGWHLRDVQPEEVLQLGQGDDDGNAVGEADDDRHRHEADHLAELESSHCDQQHARHHGGDEQVGDTVALCDGIEQRHEGAGRAADLYPRASQRGHDETADDGSDQTLFRLDPGGDAEGHCQRHGNAGHRESCAEVGGEVVAAVTLERVEEGGSEAKVAEFHSGLAPLPGSVETDWRGNAAASSCAMGWQVRT